MAEYVVKIRCQELNGDVSFHYAHYAGEDETVLQFREDLLNGEWNAGFTEDQWRMADILWIFVMIVKEAI